MGLTCAVVLVPFLIIQAGGLPGEPVMYLPPFEVRTLDSTNRMFPFGSSQFIPVNQRMLPQEDQSPMFHTAAPPPPSSPPPPPPVDPVTERPRDHHNFTLNEFVEAMNEFVDHNEENRDSEPESRAASRDFSGPSPPSYPPYPQYPPYSSYRPYGTYGPARPGYSGYGAYGPPAYQPPSYPPTTTVHTKTVSKPELGGLLKPVTTKVASKVSGLIGLVLTLLTGSAPDDLELKGFKDIVINGIVKPLLIAKGGIKSLISKLSIPVISLLLINLEVLITIWWLWEECPQPTSTPTYSYPRPQYGYSNNSPYR